MDTSDRKILDKSNISIYTEKLVQNFDKRYTHEFIDEKDIDEILKVATSNIKKEN